MQKTRYFVSNSWWRPAFRPLERGLLVFLSSITLRWRDALLLVKPDTIIGWHREGFRLVWKRKSKATKPRRSALAKETIELIQRMARENRLWGAERIRGELLKLGIRVSKRTVQKHMHARLPDPHRGQSWKTFLKNHSVWACDFLQLHDMRVPANLRLLHHEREHQGVGALRGDQGTDRAVDGAATP